MCTLLQVSILGSPLREIMFFVPAESLRNLVRV